MPVTWREPESIKGSKSLTGLGCVFSWMSIRPVAADVDPEEGVMLQSDYNTYADASDCLVFFLLLTPFHHGPCTIRSGDFGPCTIRSGDFDGATLYDINLGATHTTILSTRGVEILISLVSSTTDSIQRCAVVFKTVSVPSLDLKSEFLCQSSLLCRISETPLNHLVRLGNLPRPRHHVSPILP